MIRLQIAMLGIACIMAFACRGKSAPGDRPDGGTAATDSPVPVLPCFSPDTGPIAFGDMDTSKLDQDVSGTQFSFEVRDGHLLGYVRDAAGEIPPKRPLDELLYDPLTDTLSFSYASSSTERSVFTYRFSCERLTGGGRLFSRRAAPVLSCTIRCHVRLWCRFRRFY